MNRSEAGALGAQKSRAICARMRQERIEKYERDPTKCAGCEAALPYDKRRGRFCSHSCAAVYNNQGVNRSKLRICCECDLEFKGRSYRSKQLFPLCSSCVEKYRVGNSPFETLKSDGTKKARLIKERGHRCEDCLRKTWTGQAICLTMDHIDGNPDNGCKENLRLLCWNCHSQTPTFCGKNVGKNPNSSRKKRRTVYG
jgi:hypothetical protein